METVSWNANCCQLLFLGVLIPRKGVSDLIEAISRINKANMLGNIRLVIAGIGESESSLRQQVVDSRLANVISFAGWVADEKKKNLLLNSQILISPSYNEGLPISILEAASYGMPIIATDVGDTTAVVKNGENGYVIKPGDIDALSEAIIKLANGEQYNEMSICSRKLIKDSFSLSIFYEEILKLYNDMCIEK